ELVAGRGSADLAQFRPGMEQVAIVAPLDDGGEALLSGGWHLRGPWLRRRGGGSGVQRRPQIEANFTVGGPVEALVLGLCVEAEATARVDAFDQDRRHKEGESSSRQDSDHLSHDTRRRAAEHVDWRQ